MRMFEPLPEPKRTLLQWAVGIGAWMLIILALAGIMAYCTGCTTPGAAGFRQMRSQNVQVHKAVAVATAHMQAEDAHAAKADALVIKLAATKLDAEQAAFLSDIRLELKATQAERDAARLELKRANDTIIQQAATLHQTQAEIRVAEWESWWTRWKLRLEWFAIGIVTVLVVHITMRVLIRSGLLVAKAAAV